MNRKVRIRVGSLISTAAFATFLAVGFMATTVHAAAGTPDSNTFNVGAFDVSEPSTENGTGVGDNVVHLINPTAAFGTLCAMIYVFDDDQEPGECCGCPLSPNKLLSLSVVRNLTNNWEVNGNDFDNGVIKIVSALPNNTNTPTHPTACLSSRGCNGGCDPTFEYFESPALVGSILKDQIIADQGVATLTETNMFQEGSPDAELSSLITECAFFAAHGSGHGICNCGPDATDF